MEFHEQTLSSLQSQLNIESGGKSMLTMIKLKQQLLQLNDDDITVIDDDSVKVRSRWC